jgi:TPP-dependent 2-oxoacid decarboxylase
MTPVVTASDLEAGYAADGYARTKGLGAVSVAYGVGALGMINAIAGAYVERSPVVIVNGGPTEANLFRLRRFDVVQDAFGRMVQVYDGKVRIKTGVLQDAEIAALVAALVAAAAAASHGHALAAIPPAPPAPATGSLTYGQVFERIGAALDASWMTIADTFLGVYSATNLPVQGRDAFLCNGVWSSIRHSVGAGSARRSVRIAGRW